MLWTAVLTVSLTGCATAASDPVCPDLYEYSPEDQKRLADEFEAMPDGSITRRVITDYGVIRAQIRECLRP